MAEGCSPNILRRWTTSLLGMSSVLQERWSRRAADTFSSARHGDVTLVVGPFRGDVVERGELPDAAAERGCLEEAGIGVSVDGLLGVQALPGANGGLAFVFAAHQTSTDDEPRPDGDETERSGRTCRLPRWPRFPSTDGAGGSPNACWTAGYRSASRWTTRTRRRRGWRRQ